MAQDWPDSGASIFPSGLRLSFRASTIEEMQEKAAFGECKPRSWSRAGARLSHTLLGGSAQRVRSTKVTKTPDVSEEAPPMAGPMSCLFSESKGAAHRERDPDCSIATSRCLQVAGRCRDQKESLIATRCSPDPKRCGARIQPSCILLDVSAGNRGSIPLASKLFVINNF